MKTLIPICMLSLLLAAVAARADDATVSEVDSTYFHPAAGFYIQGDTASVSNLVAQGLSLYPDDGKLKRLKELLDQQDQQDKDNQQNQDQNKDKNQDQDQDQDQQDQKNQDQNKDKNKDQQNQDQQDQQNQQEPPEPQPSTEQMSEDEAKQLLDAMKQEEQNKRLQLHPVMGAPVKVDKDW